MISIVIPVYNEESVLLKEADYFKELSSSYELIFVDGNSSDRTAEIASGYGKVISAEKNRASQMNSGAKVAGYNTILFLHADVKLDEKGLAHADRLLSQEGYAGGCFSQVYDTSAMIFKWIAWTGNIRAKLLKVFYGDQGIFVRKDIFDALGGFPEVSIGEDVLFSKKMNRFGKVGILPEAILCSPRRWQKQGILKTFLLNLRITAGLLLGLNQEREAKAYRDIR